MQLPDHACALITAIDSYTTDDEVMGVVRTRMERRRILSLPRPAQFTFYIHEQALRLRVGSEAIMHEQLLHLVLTTAMTNIAVRILPAGLGERSEFGGAFQLAWPVWPTSTTEGVNGVSQTSWRKSSYSGGSGTNCVEVAWQSRRSPSTDAGVLVRDSKNPVGPMLTVPAAAWRGLIAAC